MAVGSMTMHLKVRIDTEVHVKPRGLLALLFRKRITKALQTKITAITTEQVK